MDEKQKLIIERNRCLLIGNIILTDEFYQMLRTENVLPETMIKDIQVRQTQEERNEKLLETLKLRGGDAYRRFRHVLHLSGHLFLADHLYGEDTDAKILKAEDIFGKFPNVFTNVSDDKRTKLMRYLESKIKEKALSNVWMKSGADRSELLEAKKLSFENEKDFKLKLDVKSKKITSLKNEVIQLTNEIEKRDEEWNALQKEIGGMRFNFKEELNKQTRFNAANNHSIMALRDRFDNFNERLKNLNISMRRFLEKDEMNAVDDDPENIKISMLEKNVKKLLQIAKINVENTSSSVNEKEVVLSMLKVSTRQKKQTLSDVVRQYIDKQEKGKLALSREMDDLLDTVRGQKFTAKMKTKPKVDLKLLKSQVAMLKVEVEHIKKKLDWKDSKITDLIQENNALRDRQSEQPSELTTHHQVVTLPRIQIAPQSMRDSPDSSRDIDNVYQQFDRYMSESFIQTPAQTSIEKPRRRGSLADVNLEQNITPPLFIGRRNSKIDITDLDILGTESTGRRKSSDLRSESLISWTVENESGKRKDISSPRQMVLADVNKSKTNINNKATGEQRKKTEPMSSLFRDGRRPSLADLITIYENNNEEVSGESNISKNVANELLVLPVVPET